MKRICVLICSLISCLLMYGQVGYYCDDKYIGLERLDINCYLVRPQSRQVYNQLMGRIDKNRNIDNKSSFIESLSDSCFIVSSLENLESDCYVSDLFVNPFGEHVLVLPRVVLSLEDNDALDIILKKYGTKLSLEPIQKIKGLYNLACNVNTAKDVLELASELRFIEGVKWCEPDKYSEWKKFNAYYSQQYYLNNNTTGEYDINAVRAWDLVQNSSNVTVAVIDDGVDLNHEDLAGSVLQGLTVGNSTGYGAPQNANEFDKKSHGTACAGIIGAVNNTIGIRGVASGVKILPVNIVPNSVSGTIINNEPYIVYNGYVGDTDFAAAIDWASERADILNISYGSRADHPAIRQAISNAMTDGRNGKGCVVVCASGHKLIAYNDLYFPANMDSVISVGAIQRNGIRWSNSNYGSQLDLVAPSGLNEGTGDVVTLDLTGNLGDNPKSGVTDLSNYNYTQNFGGTSAACSQVSGVAALMLSVNPNLTNVEIDNMLKASAFKLPAMNNYCNTDEYGYGLVDAQRAVIEAMKLSITGPDEPCGNQLYTISNLPNGYTVDWSMYPIVSNIMFLNNSYPNECYINNLFTKAFSTTLYANVKDNYGQVVKVLSKSIRSTFDMTFKQTVEFLLSDYSNIPETPVQSNSTIYINPQCTICLKSDYFDNMNVSYTGNLVSIWDDSGDSIQFICKNVLSEQAFKIQGSDGCKVMDLEVRVSPNVNIPTPLTAIATNEGYDIILQIDDSLEEELRSQNDASDSFKWNISVCNVQTGVVVYSSQVEGKRVSLNTSSWPSGVYVVRGIFYGQEATCKIVVT